MAESFRVQGYMGLDGSGFMRTLGAAQVATGQFASNVSHHLGAKLAGAFSLGAMEVAMHRSIKLASELVEMSSRTGASVENLQRYRKALKETGNDLDQLSKFWKFLETARNKALADPKSSDARALKKLGVTPQQLKHGTGEDIGNTVSETFKDAKGKFQPLIAPLLEVGGKGVEKLVNTLREGLGTVNKDMSVMTKEEAIQLHELEKVVSTFGDVVSVKVVPAIVSLINFMYSLAGALMLAAGMVRAYQSVMVSFFTRLFEQPSKRLKNGIPITPFEAARTTMDNELKTLLNMWLDQKSDERRRNEQIRRKAKELTPSTDITFEPIKASGGSAKSDSLLAVGNFLGEGANSLQSIADRQLNRLISIDNTLTDMSKNKVDGWIRNFSVT